MPHGTSSPTFSWTYTGSGFTKFYLQFSTNPTFLPIGKFITTALMPPKGFTTTFGIMPSRQWQKVLDLDADPRRYIMGYRGGSRRPSSRGERNAPTEMPEELDKEMGIE